MERKNIFLLTNIIVFLIVMPVFSKLDIVNADKPVESLYTLLFMEDGVWKDYEGNEKVFDEAMRLGQASQERSISAWHYADNKEEHIAPHWSVDGKFRIFDKDLGDEKTYYNSFNEKMKDHKVEFEFDLPDEVKSKVEAGKEFYVTVKAGKHEENGIDLDAEKIFHGNLSQAGANFEVSGDVLILNIPVKLNFMVNSVGILIDLDIVTINHIVQNVAMANGRTTYIQQNRPGTPVPDFGYGRLMGALWKFPKESGPKGEDGKVVGIGSVDIDYTDGKGFIYSDEDNPWWIGNLQMKDNDVSTVAKFDEEMLEYYTPLREGKDKVRGKDVAIGVDGAFINLAAVGVEFFYPLELAFYLQEEPGDIAVNVSKSVSSANPGKL